MLHDARRKKNIQIGLAGFGLTILIILFKSAIDSWQDDPATFADPCGLESVDCENE